MDLAAHPYRSQIRLLLATALILFVFTVVIGILNGTDLVDFDRKVLLTHVHVGTLAWITLSVFASTLWLFADRPLEGGLDTWARIGAPLAAGTVVAYDLTFLTTTGWSRPVLGTPDRPRHHRLVPVGGGPGPPDRGQRPDVGPARRAGHLGHRRGPRRALRHPHRQQGRRQGPARRRGGRPPGDDGGRLPRARRPGPDRVVAATRRGPDAGVPSGVLADGRCSSSAASP